jgi:large subunit ribosomal protein L30
MAKTIKVTLVRSMIGKPEAHRQVLRGMGLKHIRQTVELQDTPAIRGMVHKVSHMVSTEEGAV